MTYRARADRGRRRRGQVGPLPGRIVISAEAFERLTARLDGPSWEPTPALRALMSFDDAKGLIAEAHAETFRRMAEDGD